jgi:uncharacterized YccA/Bax inhibitor family protein
LHSSFDSQEKNNESCSINNQCEAINMREITDDEVISITGAGLISTLVDDVTSVISDTLDAPEVLVGQAGVIVIRVGGLLGLD